MADFLRLFTNPVNEMQLGMFFWKKKKNHRFISLVYQSINNYQSIVNSSPLSSNNY